MTDPFRAWRIELLSDRVGRDVLWGNLRAMRSSSPEIYALAGQTTARWRRAIELVHADSPAVADRLLAALTCVVRMPDGSLLPAWGEEDPQIWSLLETILDRDGSIIKPSDAAEAWLGTQPPAAAWVIEDAVSPKEGCLIGLAELTGMQSSFLAAPSGAAATQPIVLNAFEAKEVRVRTGAPAEAGLTESITVRRNDWNRDVVTLSGALDAAPPGLFMSPLLPAWNMASWRSGAPRPIDPRWATAALLRRSAASDAWEVYIECARPASAETQTNDTVSDRVIVSVGPPGRKPTVLSAAPPRDSEILDRWTARLEIPPEAIPDDGALLIGIARTDSRGLRTSWPRPMMPGQPDIPRALISLANWGSLTQE